MTFSFFILYTYLINMYSKYVQYKKRLIELSSNKSSNINSSA